MTRRAFLLIGLACLFVLAAGAAHAGDRDYSQVYKDKAGKPFIKVTVTYLGKKPVGAYRSKHNWRRKDTDFYKVAWQNLSTSPIEFLSVVTVMTKGPAPKVETHNLRSGGSHFNSGEKEPLARYWPDTTLAPGASLVRTNKYVYSTTGPTTAVHTYEVRYQGQVYEVAERRAYRRKP